ncbi:unnamed protein product [Pedinophyceae sp. YPF-701]|nr:unnamed protein product [Pedinophyceae sp. YPF-701]
MAARHAADGETARQIPGVEPKSLEHGAVDMPLVSTLGYLSMDSVQLLGLSRMILNCIAKKFWGIVLPPRLKEEEPWRVSRASRKEMKARGAQIVLPASTAVYFLNIPNAGEVSREAGEERRGDVQRRLLALGRLFEEQGQHELCSMSFHLLACQGAKQEEMFGPAGACNEFWIERVVGYCVQRTKGKLSSMPEWTLCSHINERYNLQRLHDGRAADVVDGRPVPLPCVGAPDARHRRRKARDAAAMVDAGKQLHRTDVHRRVKGDWTALVGAVRRFVAKEASCERTNGVICDPKCWEAVASAGCRAPGFATMWEAALSAGREEDIIITEHKKATPDGRTVVHRGAEGIEPAQGTRSSRDGSWVGVAWETDSRMRLWTCRVRRLHSVRKIGAEALPDMLITSVDVYNPGNAPTDALRELTGWRERQWLWLDQIDHLCTMAYEPRNDLGNGWDLVPWAMKCLPAGEWELVDTQWPRTGPGPTGARRHRVATARAGPTGGAGKRGRGSVRGRTAGRSPAMSLGGDDAAGGSEDEES